MNGRLASPRVSMWNLARATLTVAVVLGPILTYVSQRQPAVAADDARVGAAGTNIALPATDSEATVRGRGAFSSLEITVNQTQNLTNQAVSITWTGGQPTTQSPAGQYLQLMQCWGDDDGSQPDNPGPPPEQCIFGAGTSSTLATTRIISFTAWPNYDPTVGVKDPLNRNVWRPFRAVDGTVIESHLNASSNQSGSGTSWLNPYFDQATSNEISRADTQANGTGVALMQLYTGIESSGLGCGQRRVIDGTRKEPKCWLVVVPRGTPTQENVGSAFETNADQFGVYTSPLAPLSWANRIAVPLEFNPVDASCALSDDERRVVGSELSSAAIASWQPILCAGGARPPYSYAPVSDATARQLIVNPSLGAPGLAIITEPIRPAPAEKPLVYAPITATGLTIGFTVDRQPKRGEAIPPEEELLRGSTVANLNLTPRLVAKLLTQSYQGNIPTYGSLPASYSWLRSNPTQLTNDPEFVRFNPEFELLDVGDGRTVSGLIMPAVTSDAVHKLWQWILADPETAAWLRGAPDEWGMTVNPVYSTDPEKNPSGVAFADPEPYGLAKADPYCFQSDRLPAPSNVVPPPLCSTDWLPFSRSFGEAAQIGRSGYVGARIELNPFAINTSDVWKRESIQPVTARSLLVLTDLASAARFGLRQAALSRPGDNTPDRAFVAPSSQSLMAAIDAMTPDPVSGVLETNFSVAAPNAYPLTVLTYAMAAPLTLSTQERDDFAAFIEYAVGDGQTLGLALGQLPPGYVPLPDDLRDQAETAAVKVRELQAPSAPASTTTTTATTLVPAAAPSAVLNDTVVASTPTATTRRRTSATTTTVPAPVETPTTVEPTATVAPSTTVAAVVADPTPRALTPGISTGINRMAMPFLAGLVPLSALLALEITKWKRRTVIPTARPDDEEED